MLRAPTLAPALLALLAALALASSPALAVDVKKSSLKGEPAAAAPAEGGTNPASGADHGGAAAHSTSSPNILEPQAPLAFWTLIVFLVLLLVLWRFAWGPLSRALHDREHQMEATLRRVEEARAESERLLAEHNQLMAQAQDRAQAVLEQARRDAEATAVKLREAAQQEAESTLERARREIESARDQALLEVWTRTADLAVSVAGKVLGRELHEDDHRRLIEVARAELPASPNGHEKT